MNRSNPHITALLGALVCVIYLYATVGFDIHSDHHDNKVYVTSLLKGIDCESIHPEDDCNCCHHSELEVRHEDGLCDDRDTDCTDQIEILSLTGTNGSDQAATICQPLSGIVIQRGMVRAECTQVERGIDSRKHSPPPPILTLFCVFRV